MSLNDENPEMKPMGYTVKTLPLKQQRGFTLLEVLIALLVLSIGLLGLAALQTVGLRSNQMATMRTQATWVAYEITDRIRANLVGTYELDADNNVTGVFQHYVITSCPPADVAQAMALDDRTEFCNTVSQLPGGQVAITQSIDADNVASYLVTVYWDEARTGATGTACGPDVEDDLRCIQLPLSINKPLPNV